MIAVIGLCAEIFYEEIYLGFQIADVNGNVIDIHELISVQLFLALRAGFTFLATDMFASVFDAFAFVRFRFAPFANIGGNSPDEFLIDTVNSDSGSVRSVESDTGWRFDNNGMRITESKIEIFTLLRGMIADACYFIRFLTV